MHSTAASRHGESQSHAAPSGYLKLLPLRACVWLGQPIGNSTISRGKLDFGFHVQVAVLMLSGRFPRRSVEEQMCSYAAIMSQKSDQYGINIAEDADGDGDIGLDCCSLHGT